MVDSTTAFGSGSLTDRRLLGDTALQLVQRRARMGQRDNRFDHGIPFRSLPFGRSSWHGLTNDASDVRGGSNELTAHRHSDLIELLADDFGALVGPQSALLLQRAWRHLADRSAIPPPVSPPRSAKDRGRRAHRMERLSPSGCFGTADRRWQCDTGNGDGLLGNATPLEQLGDCTNHPPRLNLRRWIASDHQRNDRSA